MKVGPEVRMVRGFEELRLALCEIYRRDYYAMLQVPDACFGADYLCDRPIQCIGLVFWFPNSASHITDDFASSNRRWAVGKDADSIAFECGLNRCSRNFRRQPKRDDPPDGRAG